MDYMEKDIFKLDDSWKNIRTIIPFGLGRIGKRVLPKLKETFHIPFIIDNGVEERAYDGISIYRLGDALPLIKDNKIVVMTKENIYEVISKELKQRGYVEYRDYCILERFMAEWHFKYERKCYLSKINSVITSKCSFNCNHCAMFIPYCEKREDCSLTSIKENLKSLFSVVDYIFEYTLLGGEPFLHKELKQILEMCIRDRIKILHLHENDGIEDLHQIPYTFGRKAGDGFDWEGLLAGLRETGYDGVLNFETFPSMNSFPESVKEEVLRTIAGIGRYFASRIEDAR